MAINCIGINNYKLFTLFLPLTFLVRIFPKNSLGLGSLCYSYLKDDLPELWTLPDLGLPPTLTRFDPAQLSDRLLCLLAGQVVPEHERQEHACR